MLIVVYLVHNRICLLSRILSSLCIEDLSSNRLRRAFRFLRCRCFLNDPRLLKWLQNIIVDIFVHQFPEYFIFKNRKSFKDIEKMV